MDVQALVVRVFVDSPSNGSSSGSTYVDVPVLADTTAADVLRCCLLPGDDESCCHLVVSSTGGGSQDLGNGDSHGSEAVIEPGSRLLSALQRQLQQQQKMAAISGKVPAVRSGSGHADGVQCKLYIARRSKAEDPASVSARMDQRDKRLLQSGVPSASSVSLPLSGARGAPKRDLSKGWSFAEIQQLALQQRQQMAANQELLADRERQLHELAALDVERARQTAADGERLRHLQAHAAKQEARLLRVRAAMAANAEAVLRQKQINSELTAEVDTAKAEFHQKEKALASAVAKVADLTMLLEQLRTEVKARAADSGAQHLATAAATCQNDRIEALQREYEAVKELRAQRGRVRARLQESMGDCQRDAALVDDRLAELQLDVQQRHQAAIQQQLPAVRAATSGAGLVTAAGAGSMTNASKTASNVAAVEPFLHNPAPSGINPRGHDLQSANVGASGDPHNIAKEHAERKPGLARSSGTQQIISTTSAARTKDSAEAVVSGGNGPLALGKVRQPSSLESQSAVLHQPGAASAGKVHGQPSAKFTNGVTAWQQPQQQLRQPQAAVARADGHLAEPLASGEGQSRGVAGDSKGDTPRAPLGTAVDSGPPAKGGRPLLPPHAAPASSPAPVQHQQVTLPPASRADGVVLGGGGSVSTARVTGFQHSRLPVAAASSASSGNFAGDQPGFAVAPAMPSQASSQPPEQALRLARASYPGLAMQPTAAAPSAGRSVTAGTAADARPAVALQSMLPRPWVNSVQSVPGGVPSVAGVVATGLSASSATNPAAAGPTSGSTVQASMGAAVSLSTATILPSSVHTTTSPTASTTGAQAAVSKQLPMSPGSTAPSQATVQAVSSANWQGPRPQNAVASTQAAVAGGVQGSALRAEQLAAGTPVDVGLDQVDGGVRQPTAPLATLAPSESAGQQPLTMAALSAAAGDVGSARIVPGSMPDNSGSAPWTAVSPFARPAPKDACVADPTAADLVIGKSVLPPVPPSNTVTAPVSLPGQVNDGGVVRPAMVPTTAAAAAAGSSSGRAAGAAAPTSGPQSAMDGWSAASSGQFQSLSPVSRGPSLANSKTESKPMTDIAVAARAVTVSVPQNGIVVASRATSRLDLELLPVPASLASAEPANSVGISSNQVTLVTDVPPGSAGTNNRTADSQPPSVLSPFSSPPSTVSPAAAIQPSALNVAVADDGEPQLPGGTSSLSPSKKVVLETAALRAANPPVAETSGNRGNRKRRVSFDPLALLLDAALEGELDLVKVTSEQVSNASAANDEGITALHNAICAGHQSIVEYLVEFGCDVNAQDTDGWTPLHCAASCNNLPLVKYLVEHGACVFAATLSDHETAVQKCEEGEDGYEGCHDYLKRVQDDLGVANGCVVYALYDYDRQNDDELDLRIGQRLTILRRGDNSETEWWWACHDREDGGDEGYVPRNLLGMCKRLLPRDYSGQARD